MEFVIAAALLLAGAGSFWYGMRRQRLAELIDETPTTPTSSIDGFGLHEINGVIECEQPLETPGLVVALRFARG